MKVMMRNTDRWWWSLIEAAVFGGRAPHNWVANGNVPHINCVHPTAGTTGEFKLSWQQVSSNLCLCLQPPSNNQEKKHTKKKNTTTEDRRTAFTITAHSLMSHVPVLIIPAGWGCPAQTCPPLLPQMSWRRTSKCWCVCEIGGCLVFTSSAVQDEWQAITVGISLRKRMCSLA